jgi:hypothetical protein
MSRQEYLQRAEDCEKLARLSAMASVKEALLATAAYWRKMAATARSVGGTRSARPGQGT